MRQAETEILIIRRAVREQATEAYFAVVAARSQAALADSLASLVQAFANASARRRTLGDAGALEAIQAAVEADRAALRQAEARGEVIAAEGALRALLGGDEDAPLPEALLPDTSFLRRKAPTEALDTLLARSIAASPEVVAARAARDVARANRQVVAYERRASVAVEGSHQTIGARPGFLGAGIRVSIPFGRQANRAPDQAAEASEAAAEAALAQAERNATVRAQAQAARFTAALATLTSFETRLLPRSEEAYRIALRLRAAGEATYFEVLAAQNALVEARAGYARAAAEAARQRAVLDLLLTPDSL